jgi:flagellar biosynthesis component FlhA
VAILASSPARFFLRQMLEPGLPNAQMLSHGEVPPGVRVVSLGLIQ